MRLSILTLLAAAAFGHAQETILFKDTFDRSDSRNIDASLTGITDDTGAALAADFVYTQSWVDPNNADPIYGVQDGIPTNGGGAQILANRLQLAVGAGTSNAYVNHNFVNPEIVEAGGFSVSLDVRGYNQATAEQGGGFAVGMSQSEVASATDAWDVNPSLTGAFNIASTIGSGVPGAVVSDFWIALRGNNSLVWGGKAGTISGVSGLNAKTGKIRVKFTFAGFTAGNVVNYQIFLDAVEQGSGSFTWSGTDENYIGIDARDNTAVNFDNFTVAGNDPTPLATLAVTPNLIASDNPSQPVTLTWSAAGISAGATYQITADKTVSFPAGGNAGAAINGGGTVDAVVDGRLGSTRFTFTISDSTPAVIASATATVTPPAPHSPRPNVIVILADDLGWGDLGCYGGEIPTPNIDALASNGMRFRQFYNSARCSPTRCSLLTGLYPQQAAVDPANPLPNLRNDNNVTFAEMLGRDGYRTYMAGKWHLGGGPFLPENRGFQHVWRFANPGESYADQWNPSAYSLVSQGGEIPLRDFGGSFYQTDAIGDYAVDFINRNESKGDGAPLTMFLAFGSPHFPIQAPAELADTFTSTYSQGWDVLRRQRYDRQLAQGVIDSRYPFPTLGGTGPHQAEPIIPIPAWSTLTADRRADLTRRMALYAAMVRKVDDNVGKVVARLEQLGRLDNTLILFMSDNGANHERGVFGDNGSGPLTGTALANMGQAGQNDNIHYGGGWAHLGNTPLKLFKHFTHEGGIRAPLIAHWPDGFTARNAWVETPTHLVDVVSTIADATGAPYPTAFNNHPVLPMEGISLLPVLNQQSVADRPIFVEHESNRMVRKGKWKLVTEAFTAFDNEFTTHQKLLYDMDADPGETTDLAAENPAKVVELVDEWNAWSTRVGLPATRLIVAPPENLTPASTPEDLFLDTFNRPNENDADASSSGMSGSRVPPLGTGVTWFEGFEGSGAATSTQVVDNVLQMATGLGMGENGVNHNFIGPNILAAGGFSVSLRILNISNDPTDLANRFAGFGVGLNAAQAAGGNDIAAASPPPIRGLTGNPGTADCFLELDLAGNVKLWTDGILRATVPVGKTRGTLTAAFACSSFSTGATVTVSAYLDGIRLDLDPGSPATSFAFIWDETDANFIALSARATNFVQVDNFAVRKLPLSTALVLDHALKAGLQGGDSASAANPDGDRLDNFGEWAFGTNPARADDELAATSLALVQPASGIFRFAHRRLTGFEETGLEYRYQVSEDLETWRAACVVEESVSPLPASPEHEVVTFNLSPAEFFGRGRIFLKMAAGN